MRPSILLVLGFFAVTVSAAPPILGPEIVVAAGEFTPAPTAFAAPAVAVARDAHGVAIAWAMPTDTQAARIHIVRLDSLGRIDGPIRVVPSRSRRDTAVASAPSLAPAPLNEGFVVAWNESVNDARITAFAFLDADLTPSATASLGAITDSPPLVRTAATTWIAAGGEVFQVERDGSARRLFGTHWIASDAVMIGSNDLATVSGQQVTTGFDCRNDASCTVHGGPFNGLCFDSCKIFSYAYQLRLTHPSQSSDTTAFSSASAAQPSVERRGENLLVAWMRGQQSAGGEVVASIVDPSTSGSVANGVQNPIVLGHFGADEGPTRPDIATDDVRHVIVWRSTSAGGDHDIIAASLERDGTVVPFDVAASIAEERDPSVAVLSNGRFLIAYEKMSAGQRSIAWRIASFGGRRRAVR